MIVTYTGRRGSGKTLTMIKDALTYSLNGWTVYSNIELGFEHEYMSEQDMLGLNDESDINNSVLVIDEIQTMLDSRRSARGQNLDFSYFVQQIRKRNVIILCTTQFIGTVDVRLRQHADVLAKPRFYKDLQVCEVTYIDLTAVDESDLWGDYINGVVVVYDAKPIFELYDTSKMVKKIIKEKKK